MISQEGLLFIEPVQPALPTPIVDHLTRRMAAAFRLAHGDGITYCGVHECVCGALSTSIDYYLPSGHLTHSLCVHYVAYHRAEIPARQLAIIEALSSGEVQPSNLELEGRRYKFSGTQRETKNPLHEPDGASHLECKWWQFWK